MKVFGIREPIRSSNDFCCHFICEMHAIFIYSGGSVYKWSVILGFLPRTVV